MKQNNKYQKLELTWVGKGEESQLEPRILIESPEYSYGDKESQNMMIHGDNLLALKALEQEYAGKVKCIYIDPPYNTGNAFEHYDDGIEHSIWLDLMSQRLKILKTLLKEDGVIFIQLDDNEGAYLKVLMDEVFGRNNYINTICIKTKNSSGASGGGEDKRLKKNIEFIFVYSKSEEFLKFTTLYEEIPLNKYIDESSSFAYNSVLVDEGSKTYFGSTKDVSGEEIKIFKHTGHVIKSVAQLSREEQIKPIEIYKKYFDRIYTLENAQTSIRTRVMLATDNDDTFYSIEYVPISGRNKGRITQIGFMGRTKRLVSFLKYTCTKNNKEIFKRIKVGTLWTDMSWSAIASEGSVDFPQSKKPEKLISRIFDMATNHGDLVLDSFLGSGTTAAVAHKMGRRYIGIELGNHAYTHCVPRMQKVVDGEQGGISKAINWQGGGGFKFYELAPSLLNQDEYGNWIISKEYNPDMLAAAMAKQENFVYQPDAVIYWKQGKSTEKDFIFTTTQFVSGEMLDKLHNELAEDETLLICATSFAKGLETRYSNIKLRKIPLMLLGRCEFGKDDYSLNIINLPTVEDDSEDDEVIEDCIDNTCDNNTNELF